MGSVGPLTEERMVRESDGATTLVLRETLKKGINELSFHLVFSENEGKLRKDSAECSCGWCPVSLLIALFPDQCLSSTMLLTSTLQSGT